MAQRELRTGAQRRHSPGRELQPHTDHSHALVDFHQSIVGTRLPDRSFRFDIHVADVLHSSSAEFHSCCWCFTNIAFINISIPFCALISCSEILPEDDSFSILPSEPHLLVTEKSHSTEHVLNPDGQCGASKR